MLDLKNAIIKLFPELSGGLHLDRYARVIAIADPPQEGATCERFRPRYAVDIEILTPKLEPDPAFPQYTAVPLPVAAGAGGESGSFGYPEPGSLLVVGFAYGRHDHPIIRQVYPMGTSLPKVELGELLLQKNPAVYQQADKNGNWTRTTDAAIHDVSTTRTVKAMSATTELSNEEKTVSEHQKIEVGGMHTLEVGGNITMLAGNRADLGTLGDLHLTAGASSTHTTAANAVETVGGNHQSQVMGNRDIHVNGARAETVDKSQSTTIGKSRTEDIADNQNLKVGGESKEIIGGNKNIVAANITLRAKGKLRCISGDDEDSGISLYRELLWAIDDIKSALDILSWHNHPEVGTINQGSAVAAHSTDLGRHRGIMGDITG